MYVGSLDLNWIPKTGIFIIIVCLIFGLALRTNDPYGSYHIPLNARPGDDPKVRPRTEWLNMGYWKDTQIFPEACEALALKVIGSAQCVSGGHVLDVGHGCGDSLLLHLSHPTIPHPATLTGITSLNSQHNRALERIANYQSSRLLQPCEVRLFHSDAIFHPGSPDHPLNPSSSTPPFTTITALDCAYHFVSREVFLRQAFVRLSPGGTIALGDLVISKPLPSILRMVLSKLLSVRSENMITPDIYKKQLEKIGFTNIRIEDVSNDVFPRFRLFLKSRGSFWRLMEFVIGAWAAAGGKFLICSASKPGTLAISYMCK